MSSHIWHLLAFAILPISTSTQTKSVLGVAILLKVMCPDDSEGVEGLCVYYWSKFSAPPAIAEELRRVNPARLQRRLPGTNKVLFSKNEERYYMERDEDTLRLLG